MELPCGVRSRAPVGAWPRDRLLDAMHVRSGQGRARPGPGPSAGVVPGRGLPECVVQAAARARRVLRYIPFMSTGPTGWAPLIFTGLVTGGLGSVVGSIISTYGVNARIRREARSKVVECLTRIETERRSVPTGQEFHNSREHAKELELLCFIAGIRTRPSQTYRMVLVAVSGAHHFVRDGEMLYLVHNGRAPTRTESELGNALIAQAAACLTQAIWHPVLAAPYTLLVSSLVRRAMVKTFPVLKGLDAGSGPAIRFLLRWGKFMTAVQNKPEYVPTVRVPSDLQVTSHDKSAYASSDAFGGQADIADV